MIKSMTGYGQGVSSGMGRNFTIEIKAVNNRFCDVSVRLPRFLLVLEERLKKLIQAQIARGRVDCFLSVEKTIAGAVNTVKVDKELAAAYYKAMQELRSEIGVGDRTFDGLGFGGLGVGGEIKAAYLSSLPGVLNVSEAVDDAQEFWPAVQEAAEAALTGLLAMRVAEGEKLARDLRGRLALIAEYNAGIKNRAAYVVEDYKEKITTRLQDYIKEGVLEPARLAAEVAIFAERSDITEETVRIESHVSQMTDCLGETETVGRKLDFLTQELNREINTIGSKANDLEISKLVIAAKSELEKVREQVQNIE